jgi:hypothetical protein
MKYWSESGGGISIPPANASAPVYSAPVNTVSPPANISMPVYTSPPSTGTTATASASIPLEYILIGVIALIAIIALAVILI